MKQLKLSAGPCLQALHQADEAAPTWVPVTGFAHRYLFEDVTLEGVVTLQDIFGLLAADPVLVDIYRREAAAELLAHAQKGALQSAATYHPDSLEYLELYQGIEFDTDSRVVEQLSRLDFHGMGFELQEDYPQDGFVQPKGSRIQWSISLTDVRNLLHLPVRVRTEVPVYEGDLAAKAYGKEIFSFKREGITLGQLLHGILWELSFYGVPEDQAEFAEELQRRSDDVSEQLAKEAAGEPSTLVSLDDFFEEFERRDMQAVFEATGDLKATTITRALRELEDDEPVVEGLARVLGDAVNQLVFRPETQGLNARAFRKAIQTREASYANS